MDSFLVEEFESGKIVPSMPEWARKRSTERLRRDLNAAIRFECECDDGFTCGKHRRIDELRAAIWLRTRNDKKEVYHG
jgi:hypothetical protein